MLYRTFKSLDLIKPKQITISDYKENKTNEQRNTFHKLCGLFGEATGYTKNEIKELVKAEVLDVTVVTLAGREIEVRKSSEEVKRDEYSVLIETTYRLAAEAGVVLPILSRH
jgi:hypothetical protein